MYRIRLHHGGEGWAYWRRCMALQKYAPDDFEVDVGIWHPINGRQVWGDRHGMDLILQLVPDIENLRHFVLGKTIIVGGLNVGWGHHSERLQMCRAADHLVINNRDLWERLDRPEGTTWISNGVDLDTFRITQPLAERTPRVLWTGCTHHCTKTNIKGWREVLKPLARKLEAAGIPYDYRQTPAGVPREHYTTAQMVEWYNTGTIYVCASSSEGTPNPALEAAACGCVVVSTRVGNMPELIEQYENGELVDRDADEILAAVMRCQRHYRDMAANMRAYFWVWDWEYAAAQYYTLFRRLIKEGRQQ